ncbi:MAG: hypothetical protein ACRDDA_05695, partial [Aeromonas sp.]
REIRQLGLTRQRTSNLYRIHTIQGKPLGSGRIQYQSPPLLMRVGNLHSETVTLMILEHSTTEVVLGRLWLELHNPCIDWSTSDIVEWISTVTSTA